jgi:hypothetical protein
VGPIEFGNKGEAERDVIIILSRRELVLAANAFHGEPETEYGRVFETV